MKLINYQRLTVGLGVFFIFFKYNNYFSWFIYSLTCGFKIYR